MNERLRRVVHWLISQGFAESHEAVANKLGHNKTYLSQILTGQKPVSKKFVKNVCQVFERVNPDYILDGIGDISTPKGVVISLFDQQEQTISREAANDNKEIAILREQNEQYRKEIKELTEIAAVLKYQLETINHKQTNLNITR